MVINMELYKTYIVQKKISEFKNKYSSNSNLLKNCGDKEYIDNKYNKDVQKLIFEIGEENMKKISGGQMFLNFIKENKNFSQNKNLHRQIHSNLDVED